MTEYWSPLAGDELNRFDVTRRGEAKNLPIKGKFCIECIVNQEAWNELPEDLQEIVRTTCQAINLDILSEYLWGNAMALDQLRKDPDVELKELPQEVFDELRRHASDAVSELSERDEWSARVAKSVFEFMEKSSAYPAVSELAYLNMRVRGR